jgi:6-phosphofructokinase 2
MQVIATLTMNPAIDKSSSIDHVIAERKLRCNPPSHEPGGGGINVSRAIKKLGGSSLALCPSGGPPGLMLQDLLNQEGIRHIPIGIRGWTRENFTVLEEATDQQYRFGMPGPVLMEKEWRRCLDELLSLDPKPDYIVASGSLPPGVPKDFYAQVVQGAKKRTCKIIVDTSREALRLAAEAGVYLLKPNMNELAALAGEEIKDEPHQVAVAEDIVRKGQSEVVVISLGAAGALMITKEGSRRIRSPIVPIRSKVGAGDSMVGGIVLSLARGKSLPEAVSFGVAAGAAAVMTPGTELCRREDTERIYQIIVSEQV